MWSFSHIIDCSTHLFSVVLLAIALTILFIIYLFNFLSILVQISLFLQTLVSYPKDKSVKPGVISLRKTWGTETSFSFLLVFLALVLASKMKDLIWNSRPDLKRWWALAYPSGFSEISAFQDSSPRLDLMHCFCFGIALLRSNPLRIYCPFGEYSWFHVHICHFFSFGLVKLSMLFCCLIRHISLYELTIYTWIRI